MAAEVFLMVRPTKLAGQDTSSDDEHLVDSNSSAVRPAWLNKANVRDQHFIKLAKGIVLASVDAMESYIIMLLRM